jgi:hypothetical protein
LALLREGHENLFKNIQNMVIFGSSNIESIPSLPHFSIETMSFRRGQGAKNGTLNRSEAPPQPPAAVETPAAPLGAVAPVAPAPVQQQLAVSSGGWKDS